MSNRLNLSNICCQLVDVQKDNASSQRLPLTENRLQVREPGQKYIYVIYIIKSAGLAGVSSGMGLDDGLLVCTLLLLI